VCVGSESFSLQASARPTGGVADPWDTQLKFAAYNATLSAEGQMSLAGDSS
jgi:hypothetical protein